jgi:C-terminal processing protease CtpA/Prc
MEAQIRTTACRLAQSGADERIALQLTTSVAVDSSGHVYGGSVTPDVLVSSDSASGGDPALERTTGWLAGPHGDPSPH